MIVSQIIYNVALLFVMMVPGIILKKCNMISDGFSKGLSNLVLYIAQPALIFLAYLKPFDKEILINSLYVFAFSIVAHSIFTAASWVMYKRTPDERQRMLRFATIFSNAAFMGIPLIAAVLEESYPGATLYASIYNITFNLFLWSIGVLICNKGRDENENGIDDHHEVKKASFSKAIIHPVTIAALLGLLFFILPIDGYIPKLMTESLIMLKNLVAPLSMVVIGIRIADIDLSGIFKDKYMYLFLSMRHFILPGIIIALIKLLGLIGLEVPYVVSMVVVILASAPAASSATMFAEKYDCDSAYVSRLVTVSTILSIVTMPLIIMLM